MFCFPLVFSVLLFYFCVDLDLCSFLYSLLLCVYGGSLSELYCHVSLWLVGWGPSLYQHLSPNLQLGPLWHCSLFCFLMFSGLDFFVASSFFDDLLDFLFGVLTGFWWFCYGDFCFVSLISCPDVCFMFCLDSSFVFHHFPITLPVYSLLIGIVVVLCSEALGRWWLFCGFCVSSLILGLFWLGGWVRFFRSFGFLVSWLLFRLPPAWG